MTVATLQQPQCYRSCFCMVWHDANTDAARHTVPSPPPLCTSGLRFGPWQ